MEANIDNVLITGAGFLARGLVQELLARDCRRICIYSRNEFNQYQMRQEFGNDSRLRFFVGDVRDRERLTMAMSGVDMVIHTAALKRVEVGRYNPTEMVRTNVDGSHNVIMAAADRSVLRAILISSDKAVEPANAYGCSKALAEHLWLGAHEMTLGPAYTAVRYGNVAGSTGSVVPLWRNAMGPVEVRDPEATRFWITRQEAVNLVMSAANLPGGSVLVPRLPAYRLGDLATAMGVPYEVTKLEPGEKMHESMEPGRTSADARRMTVQELREALKSV